MITTSHLHPMLVHFPIALIIFGFLTVSVTLLFRKKRYLPKTGYYFLLAGTGMAFISLLSGVFFTTDLSGSAADVQELHESFAWISLFLSFATTAFWFYLKYKNEESSVKKWIVFALYGMAAISVSFTGYLGGTLVYDYMMPI